MKVPLVDLKAQYSEIKDEVDSVIERVLLHTQFILGPEVQTFEKEMAAYCGTKFAVGVASGTDALRLALLGCGIGPGDEVITTPFTFIATAETITQCGATPVFVDIDITTYNLDPKQIEKKITRKTKAILPVHLYGQSADMTPVLEIAKKYKLKVIEDCAQALGAEYQGKKVGSISDAGCLSFFPSKNLGAYGDGGMVVTNDSKVAETVDLLRKHGAKTTYYHLMPGFNSRLDALQAAILSVKLKRLGKWVEMRRKAAALYTRLSNDVDGVEPPFEADYGKSSFNYYTIRLKDSKLDRNKLRTYLDSKGISTAIYYPLSLHLQEAYKDLGHKPGDFPQSELAQQQAISLPMYAELNEEQIRTVVAGIREFVTTGK